MDTLTEKIGLYSIKLQPHTISPGLVQVQRIHEYIYIYNVMLKALELFLPMHMLQYQKTIRGDHLSL